jgi:hypothetical protein
MATHTRYAGIKKWAAVTGRRSIQLWMAQDTVRVLDGLGRKRHLGRAELLDALITEASRDKATPSAARPADRQDS